MRRTAGAPNRPAGGRAGLGYYEAVKGIDRKEWYFTAHFHLDPVMPGSLGLEAMLQLARWIFTERQIEKWYDEEGERVLQIRQCIKDHIQPHEVARMALFLGSDDSKMCTAQNFVVDAGWT